MGGRGVSSSKLLNKAVEAHKNFKINRIILSAQTKNAIRFQLDGNATPFRMTRNDNDTYTIKSGNRIYVRNVKIDEAKQVLIETQKRFDKLNEKMKGK